MADIPLEDADYILVDGAAWFTVGNAAIRIKKTARGVDCTVYKLGHEDDQSVACCSVSDNELEE